MVWLVKLGLLFLSFYKGRFAVPVVLFGLPFVSALVVLGIIRTGIVTEATVLPVLTINQIAEGVSLVGLIYTGMVPGNTRSDRY